MLEELIDLSTGLGVALLPLLLVAVPAIILFVLLPAILLLALAMPLAVIGAVMAVPPYVVVRWMRRRRWRTAKRRAGHADIPHCPTSDSAVQRAASSGAAPSAL